MNGDLCRLCGDPLADQQDGAHPECLEEWAVEIERRTCYVCGEPLDDDQPDGSMHAACVGESWDVGPDPWLDRRGIKDVDLP